MSKYCEPTFDLYVSTVMERAICTRHKGGGGGPCWTIELSNGDLARGVCDFRAKKAGFTGRISELSYQTGARKGRRRG